MDYPTVRVRIADDTTTAEVDIAPKPEPDNLVMVHQEDAEPAEPPPYGGLPTWMHYAG